MAHSNNNEYNSLFSPLTSLIFGDLLDPPDPIGLNNSATTPTGFNPSNNSTSSSPLTLIGYPDNVFMDLENTIGNNDLELPASNSDLLFNGVGASSTGIILNERQTEKLQIIAQPKASYRGRYITEIDEKKHRAKRFIGAEKKHGQHGYPTIKIPAWCHSDQQLYIRVTLVTVTSERVPYHCIHPYAIDTPDQNVIRDETNNSLYFRINENEFITHEKNFRIIVIKKKQDELKSHGPMRLFDLEQYENIIIENPQDPKQIILLYQLWKSQFVFSIAERQDNSLYPVLLRYTSVESQIMADETIDTRNSPKNHSNGTRITEIKCIPQQSNWAGGDEIVIIMPSPIKRKEYTICFNFGRYGQQYINEIIRIDTKTILVRTPSCPVLLPGDENLKISIIIHENESIISPIDFYYITPIKITHNICSRCRGNVRNNPINNKRELEDDNGEHLISQMDQLSIGKTTNKSHSHTSSLISINEKLQKFDRYIHELKNALEIFVRTNNPSQLFRKTGILLSNYDGNSSPLHDAIQHGHTQLALPLIEQIIDIPSLNRLLENENENGETPLLVAVKLNEWKLIDCILKSRSDLARQKDNDGNNLFHLLANLSEDKGVETIEKVLAILPNEVKMNLLKEQNKSHQKPMDLAQSQNNTSCLELLIDIENNS